MKVALVGKGLTFDSGGYNLKAGPGSMIELMKFDMGGCGQYSTMTYILFAFNHSLFLILFERLFFSLLHVII